MGKLEGKVAVITGGNSGIGLATAKRFVEEGAHVVITGRREKELKEAAAFIGKNVTTVAGDITRLEDLDRLYAVVKEKHGHIDVLFANAGWGEVAPHWSGYRSSFRQNLRFKCERNILHGAEGHSPLQRWRFDHPDHFGRERNGIANVCCLCRG